MRRPLLVMASVMVLATASGRDALAEPGASKPEEGEPAASSLTAKKYRSLPFDLSHVHGLEHVKLTDEAGRLLAKNGFVAVGPSHGDISRCYHMPQEMPPFITIDSVIEVFLSDFEIAWAELEERQARRFQSVQAELWDALLVRLERLSRQNAQQAANRLLGLLAVGRKLGDPEWELPADLPEGIDAGPFRKLCNDELGKALKGEGVDQSELWEREIDWSIFKPVGPYALDEHRKAYYRTSQWWGRQGFRVNEPEERLCAGMLVWLLQDTSEPNPFQASDDRQFWMVDEPTAGPLRTLLDLEETYDCFFGDPVGVTVKHLLFEPRDLAGEPSFSLPADFGTRRFDDHMLKRFRTIPPPETYREWHEGRTLGIIPPVGRFRLLPPRQTPASRVFGRVIDPHVPDRLLPRGLDLLAAWGDKRAEALTLAAETRGKSREQLQQELGELGKDLEPDYYFTFQPKLRQLCTALAGPFPDHRAPLFVRSPAYHDRCLALALATWTGAREVYSVRVDVRYGVGGMMEPLPGLMDPNLDGWQRLLELCHAAQRAFQHADVKLDPTTMEWALVFRRIAEKQLQGRPLTDGERYRFVLYWEALDNAIKIKASGDPGPEWPILRLERRVAVAFARSRIPDEVRYAGKACCRCYAVVEYGGKLQLCQGGVFDYFEFDMPPGRALSRDDFSKLMDSPESLKPPTWTKSYRAPD